jgi:hypothetical protein
MTRFDDVGAGDGRWDDIDPIESLSEIDLEGVAEVEKKEIRPACFGMACWKIREALDRGITVEIPSLGIKIEPKK